MVLTVFDGAANVCPRRLDMDGFVFFGISSWVVMDGWHRQGTPL